MLVLIEVQAGTVICLVMVYSVEVEYVVPADHELVVDAVTLTPALPIKGISIDIEAETSTVVL